MKYCHAMKETPPLVGNFGTNHLCVLEAGHKGDHKCVAIAWCGLTWPNEVPEHEMVKQSEHFASDQ